MTNNSIEGVWCKDVALDYETGWICSERALQSSIFFHLRRARGAERVFVEPKVSYVNGSPARVPDLILTEGNIVVAVVELKFFPEWSPIRRDLEPDVRRLREIFQGVHGAQWSLVSGRTSEAVMLSKDTKYYLGVVGVNVPRKMSKFDLWNMIPEQAASSFSLLVGDTASSRAVFQQHMWAP